jgi:hypothetical protein
LKETIGLRTTSWLKPWSWGHILQRAEEAGYDVHEKAKEIVKGDKERDSLTLKGFEERVEVNDKTYVVKVRDGEAVKEDRDGRKLLRIKITAEVDGVLRDYTITFSRRGEDNVAIGRAYASVDAPGGREADAERFAAVVEALTGVKPRIYRMKYGTIIIECGREHLDCFARNVELADVIEK